jgi:predicted ribosome quality control (RQC) complex YloA/Tae2 family protein
MNARTMTITAIVMHIAACTPLEPIAQQTTASAVPIIQARNSEIDLLLARFEATRALSKDEFKAELASLQRRLGTAPTPSLRTELAMLLSAPHAEARDLPQALKLLEEVVNDEKSKGSLKNLASTLYQHVAAAARQEENVLSLSQRVKEERRRADQAQAKQDSSTQQLEQKLKDEQKRFEAVFTKQEESIQQLGAKWREEQKRADELQLKLDAIMKIEKSLIERQQPKEEPKEVPKDPSKDAPKEPR